MLREGLSLLDIGADVGIASAVAARTPAVRITAIELDPLKRGVLRTNLASVLLKDSVVLDYQISSQQPGSGLEGFPLLDFR